jgi:hypothetical protein
VASESILRETIKIRKQPRRCSLPFSPSPRSLPPVSRKSSLIALDKIFPGYANEDHPTNPDHPCSSPVAPQLTRIATSVIVAHTPIRISYFPPPPSPPTGYSAVGISHPSCCYLDFLETAGFWGLVRALYSNYSHANKWQVQQIEKK